MYIPSIFCSEKMVAPLENKKVNLEINQLYTAVYTDQVVTIKNLAGNTGSYNYIMTNKNNTLGIANSTSFAYLS